MPEAQLLYTNYCGIGGDATGREILESHLKCCLFSGLHVVGINLEVGGQAPDGFRVRSCAADGVHGAMNALFHPPNSDARRGNVHRTSCTMFP